MGSKNRIKAINIIICYEGYFWNTMARIFLYFPSLVSLSLYETQRCMELIEQALATCIKKKKVSVETFSISEQSTILLCEWKLSRVTGRKLLQCNGIVFPSLYQSETFYIFP